VERAEDFLSGLGIRQKRVRHHRDVARIEVSPEEFSTILVHKKEIFQEFQKIGYRFVTLDLEGYRPGGSILDLKGE
jgi:pyridinium-3,5-biscarboxylic acid mononucleotide sulfurtransferase